jgi:hypothetical protein
MRGPLEKKHKIRRARNEARLRIIHRYRKMVDGLPTSIPR